MRGPIKLYLFVLMLLLYAVQGCSYSHETLHSARASFPWKHLYYPSYETIGAMYKSDPAFSIELLERLSRKRSKNLSYRLTLADMYKDRGRVNDAIRLWFEILAMSRGSHGLAGGTLQVYFIPIIPYQEEGMRPYDKEIDKSLAYDNIGSIYFRNAFYEEASEYFSRAAESTSEPNRKAKLFQRAGMAIGSKTVDSLFYEEQRMGAGKSGDSLADPLYYRKKEMAFYLMALALDFPDEKLREEIEKNLSYVKADIIKLEGKSPEAGEGVSLRLPLS